MIVKRIRESVHFYRPNADCDLWISHRSVSGEIAQSGSYRMATGDGRRYRRQTVRRPDPPS